MVFDATKPFPTGAVGTWLKMGSLFSYALFTLPNLIHWNKTTFPPSFHPRPASRYWCL